MNKSSKDMSLKPSSNNNDIDVVEDAMLEIEISKDCMKGFIMIIPPKGGKMLTTSEILKELRDKQIVYGIDEEKISDLIKEEKYYSKTLVAAGREPRPGEDAKITYYFDFQKKLKPQVSADGSVDFFNLNLVTNVKKDQLLAQITPPTKGVPGESILGKSIPAKDGKPARLIARKGVYLSQDELKFYSEIDGQPQLSDGKLSVLSVLEIEGDVGPATGNIDFLGTVKVSGNVKGGYEIRADGDIEIDGTVEAARLEAKGNVLLKRGMQGRGKGKIYAGENALARYVENAQIKACKDVIISEAAMHSTIQAGRKVELGGRRGLLVGGVCRAGEEILAKNIGSPMATYTELEVGTNPEQKSRCAELNQQIEEIDKKLLKLKQAFHVYSQRFKNQKTPDKQELLKKLSDTLKVSQEERNSLLKQKQQIDEEMKLSCRAKISSSNVVYPGVYIIIGNASMRVRDKISFATFFNSDGHIKIGTHEG